MSKVKQPEYASQVPLVPVNWEDRDALTRRILDIVEAVMPEGKQQERTTHLIKEATKQYFIGLFNDQFVALTNKSEKVGYGREKYFDAIWQTAVNDKSLYVD